MFAIIITIISVVLGSSWDYDHPEYWNTMILSGRAVNYCSITNIYYNKQSPININTYTLSVCPSMSQLHWQLNNNIDEFDVENNGHDIKLIPFVGLNINKYSFGKMINNFVTVENRHQEYCLDSFHFHWGQSDETGSEHRINNNAAVLEMHFVHFACDYNDLNEAISAEPIDLYALAVVAVLYEIGEENIFFKQITDAVHIRQPHGTIRVQGVSMNELVPNIDANSKFYHYEGSLTTPPCTPIVSWYILQERMSLSRYQLDRLRTKVFAEHPPNRLSAPNFRPTQHNSNPVYLCPA